MNKVSINSSNDQRKNLSLTTSLGEKRKIVTHVDFCIPDFSSIRALELLYNSDCVFWTKIDDAIPGYHKLVEVVLTKDGSLYYSVESSMLHSFMNKKEKVSKNH